MRPRTAAAPRRRPALVAAVSLPVIAAIGLTVLAARDGGAPAPAAAPTTTAAPATVAATVTADSVAESAPATPATAATARFADGKEARAAAEGLIPAYISSQFSVEVTDPACSQPATGATGEQFVCYALKPGDLVIALRATVGAERLIDLTLIADQQPTTTTPVATTAGG